MVLNRIIGDTAIGTSRSFEFNLPMTIWVILLVF